MHLSAVDASLVSELLCSWAQVIYKENNSEYIRGEGDTFRIYSDQDGLAVQDMDSLRGLSVNDEDDDDGGDAPGQTAGIVDYSAVTKIIVAHENGLPTTDMTPRFNHKLYYSSLARFRRVEAGAETWGNVLLYGDVVTSTNSLLEKLVPPPQTLSCSYSSLSLLSCGI